MPSIPTTTPTFNITPPSKRPLRWPTTIRANFRPSARQKLKLSSSRSLLPPVFHRRQKNSVYRIHLFRQRGKSSKLPAWSRSLNPCSRSPLLRISLLKTCWDFSKNFVKNQLRLHTATKSEKKRFGIRISLSSTFWDVIIWLLSTKNAKKQNHSPPIPLFSKKRSPLSCPCLRRNKRKSVRAVLQSALWSMTRYRSWPSVAQERSTPF